MTSNTLKFVWKNKIHSISDLDPNETILNYVRLKLKKLEPKKVVQKEVVEHVQLFWEI